MSDTVSAKVSRVIPYTAEEIFSYWAEGDKFRQWFSFPIGKVKEAKVEAAVGGSLFALVEQDGEEIPYMGKFQQIIRPRRIIYSWSVEGDDGEDRITVDIAPRPIGCEVSITHEMDADFEEFVEGAAALWNAMLQRIEELLDDAWADANDA